MIIMPCNPAIIETNTVKKITSLILEKHDNLREFDELKEWESKFASKPDLVRIDSDGEFHLIYIVVSHVDPGDSYEEVCHGVIGKKNCKRICKAFIEENANYLNVGEIVHIDVILNVVNEGSMFESGSLMFTEVYSKKVRKDV